MPARAATEPTAHRPKKRRERAQATRARIIDAALRLFILDGYTNTSVAALASEAGVAVQTVYFVFGTKGRLFIALVESLAGDGDTKTPVIQRDWVRDVAKAPDAARALALMVEHGTDIYVRMAPLAPSVRAACAIDPDVAQFFDVVAERRHQDMGRVLSGLATRDWLRAELTVERATDILSALLSHETYLSLTQGRGWSTPEYKAWVYALLLDQILRPETTDHNRQATAGLSFHHEPA